MKTYHKHLIVLGVVCFLFFIFGNGRVSLIGHDETFYAQTAKEMAHHHEWLTPYLFNQPQFEKPIFLYWCLRLAAVFLGFNSFAMRLFPALFASLGVAAVYGLGRFGFRDDRKAFLGALIQASSFLYIGLARTVFTDMIFCVLILLALMVFYWGYSRATHHDASVVLFFVFSAMAVLTKGPLGLLLPLSIVLLFLLIRGDLQWARRRSVLWGLLLFVCLAVPWYAVMIARYGHQFTHEFFYNDHWRRLVEAEHDANDTWYFYPMGILAGMFPWSLFVLGGVIHTVRKLRQNASPFPLFIGLYAVVIFTVFQTAHSKLVSYVFPLFPALALMTADGLIDIQGSERWRKWILLLAGGVTSVLLLVLIPALFVVGKDQYGLCLVGHSVERFVWVGGFCAMLWVGICHLWWLARDRAVNAVMVLLFAVPVLLAVLGVAAPRLDPYISARTISDRFLQEESGSGTVVCSRSLVRAVRYYTDRDVAVVNFGRSRFFSPHPILSLRKEAQAKAFFRHQKPTYCIVSRSDARALERMAAPEFALKTLATVGNAEILKLSDPRISE